MRPAWGGPIRIQWALGGLLLSVLGLWLASAPFGGLGTSVFAWRAPSLQGTGMLAMAAMSVAMLLVALALWKRLPYRRFFQTHRWLPGVYLALVFHAVVLTDDGSWPQPVGVAMALLMTAGTVAAFIVMFGGVGRSRQAVAEVVAVGLPAGADVRQVDVRLKSRWQGHEAGQFAFLRFDAAEGAHPFTLSSPWTGDGRLVFLIKGLGDYTRRLPALLHVGDLLRVEGPYGTFNFAGDKRRQVWVGAGIGITPFIARLQQLALHPDGKAVDLFYTTATVRDGVTARLVVAAQAAGVRLHVMVDAVDGRLDAERLCAAVPEWRAADMWFCGPAGFGQALRHDLLARGLPRQDFHQELFNLR